MDNAFIELLWRSLKYEEIYLKAYDSVAQAKKALAIGLLQSGQTARQSG